MGKVLGELDALGEPGIRGWDPWLGPVAGIRGWDPWLGSVAGIRTAACLVVCAVLCVRLVPTPPP